MARKKKTTEKKTTSVNIDAVSQSITESVVNDKQQVIAAFATKQGDTGSPEVQIALLTNRIENLVVHLKSNPQDNHSRRGLLGMVSKRRRLLNYLTEKDQKRSKDMHKKLKLG